MQTSPMNKLAKPDASQVCRDIEDLTEARKVLEQVGYDSDEIQSAIARESERRWGGQRD